MAFKLVGPRLVQEKACQGFADERSQHLASDDEHGHRGPGDDDRILMLEEVLHMRAWLAILARRASRREHRKSPFCQLQAAIKDRSDTGIANKRRQMLGEVLTQPTSYCGNGWWVDIGPSLPRQQSPKRRFQRVANRHEYQIELDDSFARKLGQRPVEPVLTAIPNPCQRSSLPQAANRHSRHVVSSKQSQ
jgi:hypothetical protein